MAVRVLFRKCPTGSSAPATVGLPCQWARGWSVLTEKQHEILLGEDHASMGIFGGKDLLTTPAHRRFATSVSLRTLTDTY